jgi:hypothetical protein
METHESIMLPIVLRATDDYQTFMVNFSIVNPMFPYRSILTLEEHQTEVVSASEFTAPMSYWISLVCRRTVTVVPQARFHYRLDGDAVNEHSVAQAMTPAFASATRNDDGTTTTTEAPPLYGQRGSDSLP